MKPLLILTTLFLSLLYGHEYHSNHPNVMIKSSITYKEFENSKQKEKGVDYSLAIDAKFKQHRLQLFRSSSDVDTLQPPLPRDLEVSKTFGRYSYSFNPSHTLALSYMTMKDNIAPTDNGKVYGIKYLYKGWQNFRLSLSHYYSDYQDFDVQQNDVALQYHTKINQAIVDVTLMAKNIRLDNYTNAIFNPLNLSSTQDNYTTVGFKVHGAYQGWHGGVGAWFGKRLFGVMGDGHSVQHHAMEFEQTYFMGIGKKFNNLN
ncbi:MAG: hypothetical protein U9N49_03935, partial [Campylobacterota bacterium]|nr:hypothetical protein [Campylobacterota bacterium]